MILSVYLRLGHSCRIGDLREKGFRILSALLREVSVLYQQSGRRGSKRQYLAWVVFWGGRGAPAVDLYVSYESSQVFLVASLREVLDEDRGPQG